VGGMEMNVFFFNRVVFLSFFFKIKKDKKSLNMKKIKQENKLK
jgi:hypothetical protein